MRLIASFHEERYADGFQALLTKESIEAKCEIIEDAGKLRYNFWVLKEDDIDRAMEIYEQFHKAPQACFLQMEETSQGNQQGKIQTPVKVAITPALLRLRFQAPMTRWIVILCIIVFGWSSYERASLTKTYPALMQYFGLNKLMLTFMYDEPDAFEKLYRFFIKRPELNMEKIDTWSEQDREEFKNINETPVWKGVYERVVQGSAGDKGASVRLFNKIRAGEIWRFWTPCFLHGDFLHILFNMLWLWLLGRQIEAKLGKGRYLIGMMIIGIITNTAQYLMSGPVFFGYSGIVCGLAGFLWIREKKAPWEGYNVPKSTLIFLLVFILGMLVLQLIAFIMAKFHLGTFAIGRIANTAHIVGFLCGIGLAKIPVFYRIRL